MHPSLPRVLSGCLTLLFAGTACSNPLEPSEISGIYVTVAPEAFEVMARSNGDIRLVADSLFLFEDRTAQRHVVWEWRRPLESEFTRYSRVEEFTYRIDGPTVRLRPVCPDDLCDVADKIYEWQLRFADTHLWTADRVKYVRQ